MQSMVNLVSLTLKKGTEFSAEGLKELFEHLHPQRTGSATGLLHINVAECTNLNDRAVKALADRYLITITGTTNSRIPLSQFLNLLNHQITRTKSHCPSLVGHCNFTPDFSNYMIFQTCLYHLHVPITNSENVFKTTRLVKLTKIL